MKPVTKVFLVIGALVLSLIVWALVFDDDGVLETAWNSIASPINETWASITGNSDAKIVPEFGGGGMNLEDVQIK